MTSATTRSTPAPRHDPRGSAAPAWMGWVLRAAGIYNLAWGAFAIFFPHLFWDWVGMDRPNYPFLWQCIGMIVGVYGIGYWIAASDPARHWPIVLVGLLGKIFGPLGFVQAYFIDKTIDSPWFAATLLTNDLIWWVPFTLILAHAYRVAEVERRAMVASESGVAMSGIAPAGSASSESSSFAAALEGATTSAGPSLRSMSERGPVLVVFLRHLGCTFCREALADLARERARIEADGTRICLVSMSPSDKASAFFARYGLADVAHVSDPQKRLYAAFELRRGTLGELFGPRVWVRGFVAGVLGRHLVGPLQGDGFQMPGAFVLHRGRIVRAFRHHDAADRPDYCEMLASIQVVDAPAPRA